MLLDDETRKQLSKLLLSGRSAETGLSQLAVQSGISFAASKARFYAVSVHTFSIPPILTSNACAMHVCRNS